MFRPNRAAALRITVLLAAAACGVPSGIAGPASAPAPSMVEAAPGEGVICLMALYHVAAEVGRRCVADADPAVQGELERSVGRLDAFYLDQSGASAADLARFKEDQTAAVGTALCESYDALNLQNLVAADGADALRRRVDRIVARPGRPTWGQCI